jgi:hypothetical protein
MALFTAQTYPYVIKHIERLLDGNLTMRIDPATAKRHDNCYSSESAQHNKCFLGITLSRIFSCYDTLMETPDDGFCDLSAKPLSHYIHNPAFQLHDGVHAHISGY